ncbi:MAG: hypothetical protein JSS28_01180 [Proteobacteria bacterium]|nr:hypothetical protein [Pseudomonadota bacterium]
MNTAADIDRLHFEHRYYVAAAIGVIVVVLAGFSIDIPLLSHLGTLSVLVRLHGLIMLGWIALFFVQALLVARQRVDLHMRLGIFGVVLAIAVVIADTATVIAASRLGGHHMPSHMSVPLFLARGLFSLFLFAVLVAGALALRKRRSDWHKRLMLLAALLLLDAALARFISVYTSWTVDFSTVRDGLVLACIAIDTFRNRRLHPAFAIGAVLVIGDDYIATWVAGTPTWLHFSEALSTQ